MNPDDQQQTVCESCGAGVPPDAPSGICPQCLLKQGLSETIAQGIPGASSPAPPTLEELKSLFPQLEILEFLGRGGMGAVYKAKQPRLDRVVAVKILLVDPDRPEFSQRFIREAQALARLNHPNIVTIHDVGEQEGLYYFLMEYVQGETVKDLLKKQIPAEQALGIATTVCDALQYAHDQGVVHRDIKPGNILVEPSGRIKVADFGLAKIFAAGANEDRLTMTHEAMGTPYYMAPEQRRAARDLDHRADIYSLGVLLYEMLTGDVPAGDFNPVSSSTDMNPRIDRIISRALKADPDLRYPCASELQSDLEVMSGSRTTPISATESSPGVIGAIIIVCLLLIGLSALWFHFKKHRPSVPLDVVEFNGNYYKVYYENVSWHDARRKCERMGGYLAIVKSRAEDEFLAAISRSHVWLGASDQRREGRWEWIDGSELSYTNWDQDEPNDAAAPPTRRGKPGKGEDYLMMSKYAKWNDLAARSRIIGGFICEWDGTKHPGPRRISTAEDIHAALREANPAYNGKGTTGVKDGKVVGLVLAQTGITDLSPLRGLRLTALNISWSTVTDLSPLEGMPLKVLELSRTQVEDLSPLAGLPLVELRIDGAPVKDLGPLRGMPLTYLDVSHSRVTDLSPLVGMPLQELHMNRVKVTDLSPLAGMPLKKIGLLDTPVSDISPLEKCPTLESIVVPANIKGLDRLKRLPHLKSLNHERLENK